VTQQDVAGALGVSQAFINDIEHGRRELGEKHYAKLPATIREAVIAAAKADLRDRIKRLDRIGKDPGE
jgi:transcriptional regulator with XRE-family HTH domain